MANARTGLAIRPVGQFLGRVRELYQRPPDTIRDIDLSGESGWYSPLQPVRPFGPKDAQPIQFQMWAGQNLIWTPRADAEYTAADLKMLASYPLARICLENVKDVVSRAPWEIQLRARPGETRRDVSNRQTKEDIDLLRVLNNFFQYPDREHNWQEWLRPLLDDLLVIDAPSILIRKLRNGSIIELPVIRGEMITRYIDEQGFTPMPPNPAYVQNFWGLPYCFSDDTDVLTSNGWKRIQEVDIEQDLIATRSSAKELQYQKATARQSYDHNGDLIYFASREVDIACTPNHRMIINRLPLSLGGGGQRWRGAIGETFITAEEFEKHQRGCTGIPVTSLWRGVEVATKHFPRVEENGRLSLIIGNKSIEMQSVETSYEGIAATLKVSPQQVRCAMNRVVRSRHAGHGRVLEISGDDYCALLGLYLAEGSTNKNYVQIAQSRKNKNWKEIKSILDRINGSPCVYGELNGEGQFIIGSKWLASHFRRLGHAHDKFIPNEILNATPRQQKIFWHCFWLGDGDKKRQRAFTCSERLADGLQEIAQKIGTFAIIRKSLPHDRWIKGRDGKPRKILAENTRPIFSVTFRRGDHRGYSFNVKTRRDTYLGKVHCLTVPNGTLYVRRNGKPCWVGNCNLTTDQLIYKPRNIAPRNTLSSQLYGLSPTEELAPEIEVGIERLKFVLAYYREGSVPGVIHVVPKGTNPDRITEAMEWMNSEIAGNLARRNQWRMIQGFNEPGKPDQILFSKEPLLAGLYDDKHIRQICYGYGVSPQRLMKMIRTEGKGSADAAEIEGTLPWVLWLKGLIDFIIQRKMGLMAYEMSITPFTEPDPLKNAAALTMLVSKAVLTPNEARKRVGEELRPEPEADRLGIITGTGFIPVGIPSAEKGVQVNDKGTLEPHPMADAITGNANGNSDGNANRGGTPVSQEAGGGRSKGKNVGVPSGKEDLDGVKKKITKRFDHEKTIDPDVLTPESHQAVHQIQAAIQKVFDEQFREAMRLTEKLQ